MCNFYFVAFFGLCRFAKQPKATPLARLASAQLVSGTHYLRNESLLQFLKKKSFEGSCSFESSDSLKKDSNKYHPVDF
jgi:hypothetical protein